MLTFIRVHVNGAYMTLLIYNDLISCVLIGIWYINLSSGPNCSWWCPG